jgi:hypothetical protein
MTFLAPKTSFDSATAVNYKCQMVRHEFRKKNMNFDQNNLFFIEFSVI